MSQVFSIVRNAHARYWLDPISGAFALLVGIAAYPLFDGGYPMDIPGLPTQAIEYLSFLGAVSLYSLFLTDRYHFARTIIECDHEALELRLARWGGLNWLHLHAAVRLAQLKRNDETYQLLCRAYWHQFFGSVASLAPGHPLSALQWIGRLLLELVISASLAWQVGKATLLVLGYLFIVLHQPNFEIVSASQLSAIFASENLFYLILLGPMLLGGVPTFMLLALAFLRTHLYRPKESGILNRRTGKALQYRDVIRLRDRFLWMRVEFRDGSRAYFSWFDYAARRTLFAGIGERASDVKCSSRLRFWLDVARAA